MYQGIKTLNLREDADPLMNYIQVCSEAWWFYSRYPFSEKHGVHLALAQFRAKTLPR